MVSNKAYFQWKRLSLTELGQVLDLHDRFLVRKTGGMRAQLAWHDLSDRGLDNRDLSDANLTGARLERAQLAGAKFRLAVLYAANLNLANLDRADLTRADLRGASFRGAELNYAVLAMADMRDAGLAHYDRSQVPVGKAAHTQRTDFSGTDSGGADLASGGAVFIAGAAAYDALTRPLTHGQQTRSIIGKPRST